jgi:serine/threonine-protein kinase
VLERGSRLGDYEIVAVLGRGETAYTYRAVHAKEGTEVALKVPLASALTDRTFVQRFLREAKLGSTLSHRSIVRVLDSGEVDGKLFIAMEVAEGNTLAFELAGRNPLAVVRALNWTHEVAEALAHAHASGVIHRNLKPGHIMLVPGGRVKVMDLGVARAYGEVGLTMPGVILGAPLYAAPESDDPRALDQRSDLYSLGVILFEMLQGHPPFQGGSPVQLLLMHQEQPFPALSELEVPIPRPVWELMEWMCRKDPADRPQSADEVAERIDLILVDIVADEV